MQKWNTLQRIHEEGVVAVLRGDNPQEVVRMAQEAIEGGIKVIEITMTVPKALQAIETLSEQYQYDVEPNHAAIIGVGTVLDAETARAAILAGAQFVVGPSFNEDTVRLCNRYRIPVLPGVMTVREIQLALEAGVDVVKLFPGNLYSPAMISAIKGPVPQANIMPTGGVSLDNLAEWVKAGAYAVGIGSDLTKEAVQTGDYTKIAAQAEQYIKAFQRAKQSVK